jgi:hypothetical protein
MKRRTLSIMAGVALAVAASLPAYAQSDQVKAHVPFAFSVSNSSMPAGDYTLLRLSQSSWIVRNDNVRNAIVTAARPDGTNSDETVAKLVFTKYGEHYFLSRVWYNGLTSEIAEPKPERALQIQMTSSNQKPETVFVLASAR